ncbi:MAG: FG-GAP repeat protein [Candidatus Sumerlaeia bacterium]|nr:FG-GAP repeat protein [Candidatus Sumerlaeia bacterium]
MTRNTPRQGTGRMHSMYRRHDARARVILASFMLASAPALLADNPTVNLGNIANPANPAGYSFSTLGVLDVGLNSVQGVGDLNHGATGDFAYVSRSSGPSNPIEILVRHGRPGGAPDDDGNTVDQTRITVDVSSSSGVVSYWSWVAVTGIGDFDGDGYDDLAIAFSALRDPNNDSQEVGGTVILYGPFGGDFEINSDFFYGESSQQGFIHLGYDLDGNSTEMGQAISGIGDFNGDGYHDVAVGSTYESPTRVYLLLGGSRLTGMHSTGDLVENDRLLIVENPDTEVYPSFGSSLFPLGDINGDGFDDLGIGDEYLAEGAASESLGAHILFGGPYLSDSMSPEKSDDDPAKDEHGEPQLLTITYPVEDGYAAAGATIRGLGDINGDGYPDFAVSDPMFEDEFGALLVYFGGSHWAPGTISHSDIPTSHTIRITNREFGMNEELYFGGSFAPAGDFTGNGFNDFLVSHVRLSWQGGTGNSRGYLVEGSPDFRNMDISEIEIGTWPGIVFEAPSGEDSPGSRFAVIDDINGDFRPEVLLVTNIPDAPLGAPSERAYILFSGNNEPVPMITDFYADSTTITVEHTGVTYPKGTINSIGVWSRQKFPSVGPWVFYGLQLYIEGETLVEVPWDPAPGSGHEIAARMRDHFGWSSDFLYSYFGEEPGPTPPMGLNAYYDVGEGEIIITFDSPGTGESGIGFWERELKDTTDDILQPTEPLSEWIYNGVIPLAAGSEGMAIPFDDNGGAHQISLGIRKVGEQGFSEVKDIIAAADGVLVTPRLIDVFSPPSDSAVMKAVFDPPGNLPETLVEFEYRPIEADSFTPRAIGPWVSLGQEYYPGIGQEADNLPHQPATGTSIRQVWSNSTTPELVEGGNFEHRARLVTYDMMTEEAFQIGGETYANEIYKVDIEEVGRLDINTFKYLPLSPGDMFGASVVTIGDIDGNGVPDLAVLMPGNSVQEYEDSPFNYEFRNTTIWILLMDEGGVVRKSIPVNRSLHGIGNRFPGVVSNRMEESLLAAGDVNFTGRPDLVVLDPNYMYDRDLPVTGGLIVKSFDESGELSSVGNYYPSDDNGSWFPGGGVTRFGMAGTSLGGLPFMPQRRDFAVTGMNEDFDKAIYLFDLNGSVDYVELVAGVDGFNPDDPNFNPAILAAGDVSGNGVNDLLVVSTNPDFTKTISTFHIIFRNENGGVEDVVLIRDEDFDTPLSINDVVSATMTDLTGDGVADILLGGKTGTPIHIVLLNRDGTFYLQDSISDSFLLAEGIDLGFIPSISVAVYEEDQGSNRVQLALGNRTATTSMMQQGDMGEVYLIGLDVPDVSVDRIARINNDTPNFRAILQNEFVPMEFGKSMVVIKNADLEGYVELLIGAPGYLPHGAVFKTTVSSTGELIEARKYAPGHPSLPLTNFNPASRFGASVAHVSGDLLAGSNLVLVGDPGATGDVYSPEKDFFDAQERGNIHYIALSNDGEIQFSTPLDPFGDHLPSALQSGSNLGAAIEVLPIDFDKSSEKSGPLWDQIVAKVQDIDIGELHAVYAGTPGHDGTAGGLALFAIDSMGDVVAFIMFDEINPLPEYAHTPGARLGSAVSQQQNFLAPMPLLFVGAKGEESWHVVELDDSGFPQTTERFHASQLLESDSSMPNWGIGYSFLNLPGFPSYLVGAPTLDDAPPETWPFNDQGGFFIVFAESDATTSPAYSAKVSNGSGAVNNPPGSRFGSSMAMVSTFDGLTENGSVLAVGAPGSPSSDDESLRIGSVQFLFIETDFEGTF